MSERTGQLQCKVVGGELFLLIAGFTFLSKN